jgi:class 3 adenylate cyclase
VLYGRADQDLAMPYQVFLEALGHYVVHAPDDMLARHSRRQLGELTRLVPALSARREDLTGPTATDPDAERWLLFGAVASVLTDAAERAPVVAILDDLHWADRPSVQLLRHLARTHLGRVLVLVAFRDTELSPAHPLAEALTELRGELAVERLALTGLDEAETFALMEARSGHSLGPDARALAQALQQETGGNPFFVAEVLRHLAEIGAIAQRPDGRWTTSADLSQAGLPDSVREVLSARVTRLGQEVSQVLSAAAVIGQEFDLDLLSQVSGLGEDRLLDLLETAARAQLVTETSEVAGRFRFGHALSQHTLYDALGATRQARLHLQVAEGLEKICGDNPGDRVGQLARHYLASIRLAGADKAVTYACLAAERALAALAPDEAARWYREALGVLERAPDEVQRARLLTGLGNAQLRAGDPAHRETLLEAGRMARSLGRADILVAAALANNRGWQSGAGEVDAERVAMLESAVAALGDVESGDRAQLLALLALERTYDGNYPARRNLADTALSIARRLGDPRVLLGVLNRRYQAIWVPDTFEDRRSSTAEALALAAQDPDPAARFWAAIWRTAWAYEAADRGEFIRCATMADHLAAEVGLPIQRWTSHFHQTTLALLTGDADRAEDLATEALKLGTDTGQPDAVAIYGAQLVVIRWHQGRTEELIEMVRGIASALPGIPAYRAALALLCADAGRVNDVRAMLDEETAAGFLHPHDYLLPSGMVAWSEAASLLRDQSAAALLYERLAAWPDQVAITGASLLGAVAHSLATLAGLLQWYDEAEHHFERALAIHKRLEAPFFIARTHLEWGRMVLARGRPGDRDRGRAMVHEAARLARRFGCSAVERRAAELLVGVRQGADPDRFLATVIFTDVVGSTELASRLGDRQWRSLLDQHDSVIRQELAEFSGQLVKTTGDGILATVESPALAIRCACAMREGLKRLGIDVRVGIHTGEVERRKDDIGGVGVHVAARVLAVAEAGEVLVSRTVVDLVAGSGIEFEERGEHELKGLAGPWLLFRVTG